MIVGNRSFSSLRRGLLGLLIGFLLLLAPWVVAAEGDNGGLGWLDRELLSENRNLSAYDARSHAYEERALAQERSFPQPMVEYRLGVTAPWMPHFQTTHMIEVMQTIPRRGSRANQSQPARVSSEGELLQREVALQDLFRRNRQDILGLARIEAILRLLREEEGLLEDARDVVAGLIPLGRATQSALLELELQLERLTDDREALEIEAQGLLADLSSRIGRSSTEISGQLERGYLLELFDTTLGDLPERESLKEWVMSDEPGIAVRLQALQLVEAQRGVLVERLRPEPQLMLGYMNDPPMWEASGPRMQMFQVGIRLAIPLFRSQVEGEQTGLTSTGLAISQEEEQYRRELLGGLDNAILRVEGANRRIRRIGVELLPLATDLASQILIDVELGERNITEFLSAVRGEVEVSRRLVEIEFRKREAELDLQRLTGGQFGRATGWSYLGSRAGTGAAEGERE